MSRSYVKMECLAEEVFRRKAAGETNREIGERFGLTKRQVKQLVNRQNRKKRLIENGYTPRAKSRPRKDVADQNVRQQNEFVNTLKTTAALWGIGRLLHLIKIREYQLPTVLPN